MDKVAARKLRPWQGTELHRLKRHRSNGVNSRHARIILLSRGGVCNREIAERTGCTPQWVRQIIHRFNQSGIDGITWYPYYSTDGDRPSTLRTSSNRSQKWLSRHLGS